MAKTKSGVWAVLKISLLWWFGMSIGVAILWKLFEPSRYLHQTSFDSLHWTMQYGEELLHGIRDEHVGWAMPFQGVLDALLYNHSSPPIWQTADALVLMAVLGLVFGLGRLLHSNACGGLAILLTLALGEPDLLGRLNETSVYSVLILLIANLIVWQARAPAPWKNAFVGLAVGLSLLERSPMFLFPVVLAAFGWFYQAEESARARVRTLLPLLVFSYLLLVPWIYMNWLLHGRIIPLEEGRADCNIITGARGVVLAIAGDGRKLAGLAHQDGSAVSWAVWEVVRHPVRFAVAYLERVGYVFSLHPLLFLAGFLSVWILWKRGPYRQLGLLIGYFIGIYCLTSVQSRHFMPIWPIMAVLAASIFIHGLMPRQKEPDDRISMGIVWAYFIPLLGLGLFVLALAGAYGSRAVGEQGAYEAALRKHPFDPWLLSQRGKLHLRQGRFKEAAQDFSKALALRPCRKDYELQFAWAHVLLGGGARDLIDRIKEGPELIIGGQALRTVRYLREGKEHEALEAFRIAKRARLAEIALIRIDTPADWALQKSLFLIDAVEENFIPVPLPPVWFERLRRLDRLEGPGIAELEFSIKKADQAIAAGNRAGGLDALQEAEKKKPDPDAVRRMTRLYLQLREYGRALAFLKRLANTGSHNAVLWVGLAAAAHGAGDREITLEAVKKAAGMEPDAEATHRITALLLKLGEYERGFAFLKKQAGKGVETSDLRVDLAASSREAGYLDRALEALNKAEEAGPGVETSRRIASQFLHMGRYHRAAVIIKRLIREYPKDAGLRMDLAAAAQGAGDRAAALRSLASAEALGPDAAQRRRIAAVYMDMQLYPRALPLLARLAKEEPKDAGLRVDLAAAAHGAGDRAAALRSLASAEALGPDAAQRHRIAAVYMDMQLYPRALPLLARLAQLQPRNAGLLLDFAHAAIGVKDRARALETLARTAEAKPDAEKRDRMAILYQQLGESERALEILDTLVRENPGQARYLNDRGVVSALLGRKEGAERDLRMAIQLDPLFLPAALTLGGIYASQGRNEEARTVYERALLQASGTGEKERAVRRLVQAELERLQSRRPLK